VRKIVAKCLRL